MGIFGFLKNVMQKTDNVEIEEDNYELLQMKLQEWIDRYFIDNGSRTSERQKATLKILLEDPEQDLYRLSSHGTACPFCAPREGRVYSRSGKDPVFPPLALAFQKIDTSGPDVLWNTYLVPHPNTLHCICRWTPAGRTPEELNEIKRFSSIKTNPFSNDPRTPKQIAMWKKRLGRKKWLRSYHLFEHCKGLQIEKFPKTFQTFEKHKLKNSPKRFKHSRNTNCKTQKNIRLGCGNIVLLNSVKAKNKTAPGATNTGSG